MTTVIVVEDDWNLRKLVSVNLTKRGYTVQEAADGAEAIELMRKELPDLAVIDLLMPEVDGIEVCAWLRERSDTPIIVLSAQDQEEMKVRALDIGADDYLTKPFGIEEFMARVRAVLRRASSVAADGVERKVTITGLEVDLKRRRVSVDGQDLRLTRTEFALLAELAENQNAILSHDELLARVWGPEYRGSSHYLHVYLGRIRTKLGEKYSILLETVPGVGYVLHSSFPGKSCSEISN
jgi:two-component system, OmpR family, KDP operon response regulator KdpE